MKSYALIACILIRLDARMATQVPVADLATHLQVSEDAVRVQLADLEQHGQVDVTRDAAGVITHATVEPLKHKGLQPCA